MNEMINKSIDITEFNKDTTNANTSRDRGFFTYIGGSQQLDSFGFNSSHKNSKLHQFAIAQNSSRTNMMKHDITSQEIEVIDDFP